MLKVLNLFLYQKNYFLHQPVYKVVFQNVQELFISL